MTTQNETPSIPVIINVEDAAKILRVHTATIYRWIREKKLSKKFWNGETVLLKAEVLSARNKMFNLGRDWHQFTELKSKKAEDEKPEHKPSQENSKIKYLSSISKNLIAMGEAKLSQSVIERIAELIP